MNTINKSIGVVTFNGAYNHGASLQCFALTKKLREMPFCVHVLDTLKTEVPASQRNTIRALYWSYATLAMIKRKTLKIWRLATKKQGSLIVERQIGSETRKQQDKFDAFWSEIYGEQQCVMPLNATEISHFYACICGSDQIWNPFFVGVDPDYYLNFAAPSTRKIAYAASIGVERLPYLVKGRIKKHLMSFDHISTREIAGAEELSKLLGRKIEQVLDPVFLLDKDEWSEIAHGTYTIQKEPYVLTYFLNPEIRKKDEVYRFVSGNGRKIKMLQTPLVKYQPHDLLLDAGPKDFLSLIKNADVIYTDSFHAVCFSIIFGKEFWVFRRGGDSIKGALSMDSRVETILRLFSLENRLIDTNKYIPTKLEKIDYNIINRILEKEKMRSMQYLSNALEEC